MCIFGLGSLVRVRDCWHDFWHILGKLFLLKMSEFEFSEFEFFGGITGMILARFFEFFPFKKVGV